MPRRLDEKLAAFENARAKTIAEAAKTAVCVFSADGQSGGSGVIIEPSGYALSNFHVVDPCGRHMLCGLNDGKVYHAVLVGADPVGDLALIKLIGRDDFPFARFGDSDQLKAGQECFAVGNPFLLANDFQPTVTWGIISGTHRYQYPSGTLLEYADCIQTDAAINPGNSGGPLFDQSGSLVGINGRGSFEKRGRVNVGVGYAISINQVKNFVGCLKSGRILDHATLGFIVGKGDGNSIRVTEISSQSHAYQQGIRYDSEIIEVANRKITSGNDLKNIVGTFPPAWSIPVKFRYKDETFEVMVRLESLHTEADLLAKVAEMNLLKTKAQKDWPKQVQGQIESRRGFGNYYFNRLHSKKLVASLTRKYNPRQVLYPRIKVEGKTKLDNVQFVFNQGKSGIRIGDETGVVEADVPFEIQTVPRRSGGFLNALHIFHELVFTKHPKLGVTYIGKAPFLSPLKKDFSRQWAGKKLFDVLRILRDGTESRIYLQPDGTLVAIEYFDFPKSPPCVLQFTGQLKEESNSFYFGRVVSSLNGQLFADIEMQRVLIDPTQQNKEGSKDE